MASFHDDPRTGSQDPADVLAVCADAAGGPHGAGQVVRDAAVPTQGAGKKAAMVCFGAWFLMLCVAAVYMIGVMLTDSPARELERMLAVVR